LQSPGATASGFCVFSGFFDGCSAESFGEYDGRLKSDSFVSSVGRASGSGEPSQGEASFSEPLPVTDRNNMDAFARYAAKLLRVFNSLKSRYGVEFDEILIFFALGSLNFDQSQGKPMFVKPANIVSLSDFLVIPRETLRRKLLRLEEKDLVQRTSYGFVIKDMNVWRRLGELMQQTAEADA
jgi:hypothetical protein